MSDYFAHWLAVGARLSAAGATPPKIFCVNWFRKGADGKFVWPGYGDNMRVLKWVIDRVDGSASGVDNLFGVSPRYDDVSWQGLAFSREQFETVMAIDQADWRNEFVLHDELFQTLAHHLPAQLLSTRAIMATRLGE
jgi:phosphoenolpyruvate carboxykinase (GTP)